MSAFLVLAAQAGRHPSLGGEAIACATLLGLIFGPVLVVLHDQRRKARRRPVRSGPGMRFACPGGCNKTHDLAAGQLVFEVTDPSVTGWLSPSVPPKVAAVILCAPCALDLVAARAKVSLAKVRTP